VSSVWQLWVAAFALGAAHAIEVDHMVAVTAFIGNQPRIRAAVGFGVSWGIGHAAVVVVVGGILVVTGVSVPDGAMAWAELGVGVTLIGLGTWALGASRRLHLHDPAGHGGHAHLHQHGPRKHPHTHAHIDAATRHRHLSTAVGALHGLAGTAPVVALVPVTMMPGMWQAFLYLIAFGLGTVLAMGTYSALAATAASRAASSLTAARAVAIATALASLGIGGWWVVRAGVELAGR
jgi:hypothetical protein